MQVVMKPTTKEVWDSLKTRLTGRVRAARLATLYDEFDRLRMEDGDELDAYAGKVNTMAARYTVLGATMPWSRSCLTPCQSACTPQWPASSSFVMSMRCPSKLIHHGPPSHVKVYIHHPAQIK